MARFQLISGPERLRRWSEEQKRALVAAGAIVAEVARRADVCAGQIYRWRQGTASIVGVNQLPWMEAHSVNGRNPDFSPCSRGSVHPGTPNYEAVPISGQSSA
jgi:hypothetical protein